MKRLLMAMVYGALGLAFGAKAQLVSLSWTGSGAAAGVSLSGELNATYNSSLGQYTAISTVGYVTITGNSATGFGMGLAGQYTLVDNSDAPHMAIFNGLYDGVPQGYLYDDQLNLNSSSVVDFGGLLFIRSDGLVVNVYDIGGNTYLTGSYENVFDQYDEMTGNFTASDPPGAVPEAPTFIAGALMLLPLGLSTVRILGKRKFVI